MERVTVALSLDLSPPHPLARQHAARPDVRIAALMTEILRPVDERVNLATLARSHSSFRAKATSLVSLAPSLS